MSPSNNSHTFKTVLFSFSELSLLGFSCITPCPGRTNKAQKQNSPVLLLLLFCSHISGDLWQSEVWNFFFFCYFGRQERCFMKENKGEQIAQKTLFSGIYQYNRRPGQALYFFVFIAYSRYKQQKHNKIVPSGYMSLMRHRLLVLLKYIYGIEQEV